MIVIWIKFIICAAVIFFSGKRVAQYGDIIAEKTGLGGLWIGVVLVAVCTSLPEIFTGVGSTLFVNAPDLTIGNIFGANTYNLLNIATLDFFNKSGPLLSSVSAGQLLTGGLSLIPLFIAALGILLSARIPHLGIANISIFSALIMIIYLLSVRRIFVFEKKHKKTDPSEMVLKYKDIALKRSVILYAIFAVLIAAAGIWLSYIGEELSRVLNLGQNFIGSLFLGFATTLPEITVSVAAMRLGAKEMAVANMLGSNLFNPAIIFINDLLYRRAMIFEVISSRHLFTAAMIVVMTAIVIAGLIMKPKKKSILGLSGYSILLIIVFILGSYFSFSLNSH